MTAPIVIVGGGFAGAEAAKRLRRRLPKAQQVVLFSRENHLCFTPLLAEVVSSSISPQHVVWPVRQFAPDVVCRTATVTKVDLAKKLLTYAIEGGHSAVLEYGQLIIACGMISYLDVLPGMAAHGKPLKTLGDALNLRNHIINTLEQAEAEPDPQRRKRLLTYVVVGGGFSGVECAGELYDLLVDSDRYYPRFSIKDIRVVLIHGRDRLLPEMPEKLGKFAADRQGRRGIEVMLNCRAQAVTDYGVRLADGTEIESETVVCTIGTTANPLVNDLGLAAEKGRLKADGDFRVPGQDGVWAMGDCAAVPNAYDGQTCPPLAQFAVRQAKHLARNVEAALAGKPTTPFYYKMKGSFAAIGHHAAVGTAFGFTISGFIAWFMWRSFYLSQMPTLGRKVQIAFDWAWDLFFPRDIVALSTEQTQRLARAHYEPGQFIFRAGEPADAFYVIEKGTAGVYMDGQAEPVATVGPGQHFGERALLKKSARTASVKAETPLDVAVITQASFQDLVANLGALRTGLQSDVARIEAAAEFTALAKNHPLLVAGVVGQVMSTELRTVSLNQSYSAALEQCRCQATGGAYIVVDDAGKMVGLVTQTDFYKAVRALKPADTPLAEVMTKPVLTVTKGTPLAEAMHLFLTRPVKRLVVVSDADPAVPVGMVTPFDILPLLTDAKKSV